MRKVFPLYEVFTLIACAQNGRHARSATRLSCAPEKTGEDGCGGHRRGWVTEARAVRAEVSLAHGNPAGPVSNPAGNTWEIAQVLS
jgi:hypothetical protein